MRYKRLGLFVTQVRKDELLLFTSRGLRKSLHKPQLISTWISVLFMVGSFLFASASLFTIYPALNFSNNFINLTYFSGSIFFTSAAYLQYLESINSDITNRHHLCTKIGKYLWFKFCPHNLGYISSLSLFIGTLFFNINTFNGVLNPTGIYANEILIWMPNVLGSILFLSASFFAWLEIYHDEHVKAYKSYTWWIIWINILGSIFFMISALVDDVAIMTTLLGAVCFFIAAFIQRFEPAPQETT